MSFGKRRDFLRGLLGVSALSTFATAAAPLTILGAAPSRAQASGVAGNKRYIFVFAEGGWDPLCVFAPLFGAQGAALEPDATPATVGGIEIVDHPTRPTVRRFFERYGSKTVVVNGLSTRSVAHEVCMRIAISGEPDQSHGDWPTLLAHADKDKFSLPLLSLSGPSQSGPFGVVVSKAGAQGQLQGLLSGRIVEQSEAPRRLPSPAAERILDSYLQRRAAAFAAQKQTIPSVQLAESLQRSAALKNVQADVNFAPGQGLQAQLRSAVEAIASGVSRCVSVSSGFSWDTHATNATQSALFEFLFTSLDDVMQQLQNTRDRSGTLLADNTVLVVMSEMGRTPQFNANQGRDHWPYTSALVVGSGIVGGRTIGGFDDFYNGIGIDANTGDLSLSAAAIGPADLGATLLLLGGADPAEYLPFATPIRGMLL